MLEASQTGTSPKMIKVVVVDDHPIVREGLLSLISASPAMKVVGEADSGDAALSLFDSLSPDIVLVDLKLPDMTGVDLIYKLRALRSDVRIIVLTTYTGDVQASRALLAGASGYLLKASLRRDLCEAIMAVFQGSTRIQAEIAAELAAHIHDDLLTPREEEVLKRVAAGSANKVIAYDLGVREDTIKAHVSSIMAKLRANDRTHAVRIGLQRGYLDT